MKHDLNMNIYNWDAKKNAICTLMQKRSKFDGVVIISCVIVIALPYALRPILRGSSLTLSSRGRV